MLPCPPERVAIETLADLLADWDTLGLPFRTPPSLLGTLQGGRTNRSYLLAADGERWVLRLDAPDSAALGIDRVREQRILAAASAAGLAPPVLVADAVQGFMITAFIDGIHVKPAGLTEDALTALFDLLARVHALNVEQVARDYRQYIANYLDSSGHLVGNGPAALPATLARRIAELEQGCASGLCHHDPMPANVVFQGARPWLLDWEYAACGWPVLDLAAIVVEWGRPAAEVSALGGVEPTLLAVACDFYLDLCRLWEVRAAQLPAFSRDNAAGVPRRGD